MKLNLHLRLNNIYGGDGFIRYEDKVIPKLSRQKTTTRSKEDIGLNIDQSVKEVSKEIVKTEIQTFMRTDGKYYLRLGGVHGKFWGLLKESGKFLKEIGDEDFKSLAFVDRMMKMVNISPIYCELKGVDGIREDKLPQILAGFGKTMIVQHYDVIPECETEITLEFPDIMKGKVEKLLEQAKNMSAFNKRRGTFEVIN